MNTSFVPATQLQRNAKKVVNSKSPFQIILNNNEMNGIIVNKKTSQYLIDSGLLEQIQEELFELNDPKTVDIIKKHRQGKTSPIGFDEFNQKHGL